MKKMALAPVCLFTYNRLQETITTVTALKKNSLAVETILYVFSDAAKKDNAVESVLAVREYLKTLTGFKKVILIERERNFGLAKSIITGVTEVIEKYGRVIVLEDDLITSPNFLCYMNQGLNFYKNNSKLWSVSGFSFPINYSNEFKDDATFGVRASSWGWATWNDRWQKVDWEVSDYQEFLKDKKAKNEFKQGGSDLCKMLNDQMTGKINSWAIRFCYAQFKNKAFDVYPVKSKVINIGFSENATHTAGMDKRFNTELDTSGKTDFLFSDTVSVQPEILKQFKKPFSILIRLKYKLLGLLK